MKLAHPYRRPALAAAITATMLAGMLASSVGGDTFAATTSNTLDLKVLLIGDGAADPTTAAWESALSTEGVPYTEVDATGASATAGTTTATGSWTVSLPTLSSGTTGYYNGVVISDGPADYAAGQLSALDSYEAAFGVRQVDGYMFPSPALGATDVSGGALDGTTGQLSAAGLTAFPELAGPIPFTTCPDPATAACTYGYPASATSTAYTSVINNTGGNTLGGIYQHPTTDPQSGVSELSLFFNYNSADIQWLLLAPGLINWVTQGTHLGEYRNYVEMDIDDTFTPDDAWDTSTHQIDYTDSDSLRMTPEDVITAAEWSAQNHFRMDQLFNFGSTVAYEQGGLAFAGSPDTDPDSCTASTPCADPLLAQFQATDPTTGKPYADDFGWISHTYDTPYLDVGCATQNYIEAELNENTTSIAAAASATPGLGGLGITSSTNDSLTYGAEDPYVFVPGNHSGFANLVPGNPATVDEPDLDSWTPGDASSGTLAAGTYEYAVTDQFNAAAVTSGLGPDGESAAYVTPEITVPADGSVSLQWQAICHAANYNIYRKDVTTNSSWQLIGSYYTPFSATLPDNSSADTTAGSTASVTGGGETELSFNDTGSASAECQGDAGYCVSAGPASWSTPPVDENAEELPWESNPYFVPAMQAVGITAVGDDASKPYPDPPDTQFGYGVNYPTTDQEYAAGQTFLEGTPTSTWPGAQVVPRHPINIYYNASTEAQELDEYNTLFLPESSTYPYGECQDSSTTTCLSSPATYSTVINSVVSQMLDYMLTNNPEPSYVHQTNLIGILPGCTDATWATDADGCTSSPATPPGTADTTGDGLLYSVLNPLLADYDSYYTNNSTNSGTTPFLQLTEGQIASVLANQSAWSTAETGTNVSASETNGTVTVTNSGSALEIPLSVPSGTANSTVLTQYGGGLAYGGDLSGWIELGTGTTTGTTVSLGEAVAPSITSASSATSNVGSGFSFTVTTTGEPAPALSESGALPSGITFTDNANGTATIAGTPVTGSGGSYPLTITATNGTGSVNQSFTLTNAEAPSITSPNTATFTTTVDGTYDITTTGYPVVLSESGALPTGLLFTDNGNGTGTIAGTPGSGTAGSYPVSITATNSDDSSSVTLSLTITVNTVAAPAINTLPVADFTLNQTGSVAVSATGSPTPAITETGTLPAGLTFSNNGNGTALLSGTPTGPTGTYPITVVATNGVSPQASASWSIVVGQSPAITSSATATATPGTAFSFTVTTTGYPAPSLSATGLPASNDLTFKDNGNGTATISGTATTADDGSYSVGITATNSYGSTNQSLSLSIGGTAPAITSASSDPFTVGTAGTFSVTTTGSPAASITETGSLPSGVTFKNNGNGTATIAGTPAAGTGGSYPITITASNGVTPNATQSFSLTVNQAPAITSATSASASVGSAFSFTVTTTGYPTPTVTESGTLPKGITFASGTLSGTAATGTSGSYKLSFTASSAAGTATQSFTLTVSTLAISTASLPAGTVGKAYSTTLAASGGVGKDTWSISSGSLPAGLSLNATTGAITGTPTATSSASITFKVTDSATPTADTATKALTLTVQASPLTITTTSLPIGIKGSSYSATLAASGGVGKYTWSISSGSLPAGLSLNATTGVISGKPTGGSGLLSISEIAFKVTDSATPTADTATKTLELALINIAL